MSDATLATEAPEFCEGCVYRFDLPMRQALRSAGKVAAREACPRTDCFSVGTPGAIAARIVADVQAALAASGLPGINYATVALPAPWGAAHVHLDGRVTSPAGAPLERLQRAAALLA